MNDVLGFGWIFNFSRKTISITFIVGQSRHFDWLIHQIFIGLLNAKNGCYLTHIFNATATFVSLLWVDTHNLLDYGMGFVCMDKMSSNIYILNENVSFASKTLWMCVWYDQIP